MSKNGEPPSSSFSCFSRSVPSELMSEGFLEEDKVAIKTTMCGTKTEVSQQHQMVRHDSMETVPSSSVVEDSHLEQNQVPKWKNAFRLRSSKMWFHILHVR